MALLEILRFAALASVIIFGASCFFEQGKLATYRRYIFWLALLGVAWAVLGEPLLRGWQQYLAWSGGDATRGLLTESPGFIYFYSFGRFALWRWIGGAAAVIVYFLSIRFIVKPSDGFKLNRGEALLIAFGIALAGWPGFVLYMMALLLLYVGILAVRTARGGGDARFPVALPATLALITIPFIQQLLIWASNAFGVNLLIYNVTNLSL